jgi:hypothetical protein
MNESRHRTELRRVQDQKLFWPGILINGLRLDGAWDIRCLNRCLNRLFQMSVGFFTACNNISINWDSVQCYFSILARGACHNHIWSLTSHIGLLRLRGYWKLVQNVESITLVRVIYWKKTTHHSWIPAAFCQKRLGSVPNHPIWKFEFWIHGMGTAESVPTLNYWPSQLRDWQNAIRRRSCYGWTDNILSISI